MHLSRFLPAVAAVVLLTACDLSTEPNIPAPVDPALDTYATSLGVNIASMTKTASGLYYKDLEPLITTGVAAVVNDSIKADSSKTVLLPIASRISSLLSVAMILILRRKPRRCQTAGAG